MSVRDDDDSESVRDRRITEDTPLLPPNVAPDEPPHLYRQNATILCFACIFLLELSIGIMTPAWNKIMERIICDAYLPITVEPDGRSRCKAQPVQDRLAELRGWQATFDCIPAIICGIPYGILADKIGRKPVLFLAWTGLLLSLIFLNSVLFFPNVLPLHLVWFSSFFTFIGGFPSVGPAMIYTIIGDVTPQAERASCYFLLNAIFLGAELLSSPIGAYLLKLSDWLPLGLGIGLIVISGPLLFLMPETLRIVKMADGTPADQPEGSEVELAKRSIWRRLYDSLRDNALDTWKFVLGNKRVMLLMLPIAFYVVGRFVQELLLQYATKRYDMEWTTAAYLLTIRSTANLFLQLVLLPAISTFCVVKLHIDPLSKDLWIARVSGITITIGALMIAFSTSPWMLCIALVVFSLGCGFAAVIRSLLNAFVEPHHQAIMNSLLAILQYVGLMIAGPVLFEALKTGFKLGGLLIGLPFICAAILCGTGTVFVFIFKLPGKDSAT